LLLPCADYPATGTNAKLLKCEDNQCRFVL